MFVPPPTLLTPHFYFPLELYVYITLINNYLAFFIYQLIILWTISINWHRWLLLNNHISKYNSFILVLYRRYINYVSVSPPPPPHTHTHTHTLFGTFLRHWPVLLIKKNMILIDIVEEQNKTPNILSIYGPWQSKNLSLAFCNNGMIIKQKTSTRCALMFPLKCMKNAPILLFNVKHVT